MRGYSRPMTLVAASVGAASLVRDVGGPFDLIGGLPVHPLIVHLAVVVLPVAALAFIFVSALPRVPALVRWGLVGMLAVGALAAWVAAESGEALTERVGEPRVHVAAGEIVPTIAGVLLLIGIAWAVVDLLAARQRATGAPLSRGMLAARIAIGVIGSAWSGYTIYAVVVAGHSGAVATWLPRVGG